MKRSIICGVLVIALLPFLNSCKDKTPAPATVKFDVTDEQTTESDGTPKSFHPLIWASYLSALGSAGTGQAPATGREYKVKITLDKAASDAAVISFTLGGNAVKNTAAVPGDYSVDGTNITIDKGATEAFITLTLYEDFSYFEVDNSDDLFKKLTITLNAVVSGPVKISDQNTAYTLTINEDDVLGILQWNSADVDMDMLLWAGTQMTPIASASAQTASQYSNQVGIEGLNIPGGFPNAKYGFSYIYYSGTANPMNFGVGFYGTIDGTVYPLANPKIVNQSYTLANINPWDKPAPTGSTPQIEQTINKTGLTFASLSAITVPASGSRFSTPAAVQIDRGSIRSILERGGPQRSVKP